MLDPFDDTSSEPLFAREGNLRKFEVYKNIAQLSTLKIIALNVCGLRSKIDNHILTQYVQDCSIICLCETRLQEIDTVLITNFVG